MRLEVLVVNGDVQVFPLNRPKIIIGSGESSDIVLKTEGVSRKHVFVLVEDDQYYVVDQGSTNGTFINEERLQPGKKVEFTSFFPVRLGENVLLTLLSDDESSSTTRDDAEVDMVRIGRVPPPDGEDCFVWSRSSVAGLIATTDFLLRRPVSEQQRVRIARSKLHNPEENPTTRKATTT